MDHMPTPDEIFGSYTAWKLTPKTWVISFMNGSQFIYLLEGDNKALLTDTGYGLGHLREFCEGLTDKEILCANTHFHPDHAAGNGEFTEAIVSEDWKLDEPSVTEGEYPYDLNSLPYPDYKKILVGESGLEIDLGNRVVKAVKAKPAHCNSSVFFVDETEGLLIVGDDMESAQVMMHDNSMNPNAPYHVRTRLENLKQNTEWMKSLVEKQTVKYILPNHNGTPISPEYLDDFIGLVDHIFQGDATIEDRLNHPYVEMDPNSKYLCRVRYRHASIFIKKEEVLKVYGKSFE